ILQGLSTVRTSQAQTVDTQDIQRIIQTLADDSMRGRAALTPDIEKAADFIAQEFQKAGMEPYAEKNYRQSFHVNKVSSEEQRIEVNGAALPPEEFLIISSQPTLSWDKQAGITSLEIKAGEDFSTRFRCIVCNYIIIIVRTFDHTICAT